MERKAKEGKLKTRSRWGLLKPASELKITGRHREKKDDLTLESSDLPDSYEETRVVLLPVDPHLVHVYWDIAHGDIKRVRSELGENDQRAQAALRFYDITYTIFDGSNAHNSFDIDVNIQARSWYVHLWSPEKSYCVDFGFRTEDGRFLPIVRSNVAETPPAWPSKEGEERYMLVEGDYKRVEIVPQVVHAIGHKNNPPLPVAMLRGKGNPTPLEKGGKGGFEEAFSGENSYKVLNEPSNESLWPMEMEEALQGKLAELYQFRLAKFSRPELKSIQNIQVPTGEADLTEMNEKGFTVGISSRVSR